MAGTLVVPQAPPAIRQLASEADLYFAGFSNNASQVLKGHKRALRLALSDPAESQTIREQILQDRGQSMQYSDLVEDRFQHMSTEVDRYIEERLREVSNTQHTARVVLLTSFLFLLVFTLLLCYLFSNRAIITPIRLLLQGVEAVRRGEHGIQVAIRSGDEFDQLAQAFNTMSTELQQTTVSRDELVREVTERKKVQETLAAYTTALEHSNKELDDFTYIVSHDLREPLRSLDAFSKFLMEEDRERLDVEGQEYLDRIRKNAQRMQALLEDLLKVSRLSRQPHELQSVNVRELLEEVTQRFEYAMQHKPVQIVVQDGLPTLTCDRVRLGEVFANLISNAIKYNDKPACRIEIGCRTVGEWYRFFVRDNGPGIEPKYFEKIFEIFQRLVPKEAQEGTGVGLTIVKKIVELHKGRVWVESTVGEGTTFHFTVPRDEQVILGKRKLGQILVAKGLVTEQEVDQALQEQGADTVPPELGVSGGSNT